jgi:hypothetical protein
MALSNDQTIYRTRENDLENVVPKSAATIYNNSLIAAGAQENGTAANIGRVYPWTNAAGNIPMGMFVPWYTNGTQPGITGNAGGTVVSGADATNAVRLIPVTGLAGTIAGDRYKKVYATDDATFTLTRPSSPVVPMGIIVQEYDTTSAFVYFLSMGEQFALAMSGGDSTDWHVATVRPYRSASGNVATGIVAPCAGKILSVYAECVAETTDADVDISVNFEIGGTNVTGGVITLLHSDAAGDKKSGTAVTAANIFHAGDAIDIEFTVNTAGTSTDEGLYNLHIVYERLIGL